LTIKLQHDFRFMSEIFEFLSTLKFLLGIFWF